MDILMSFVFAINVRVKKEDPLRFQVLIPGTTYQHNYVKSLLFSLLKNL